MYNGIVKISKTTKTLLLASAIAVLFIFIKGDLFKRTGISYLIWNLFLAWIPYIISVTFIKKGTHVFQFIIAFVFWLLFFPNAPYLITDIVHIPAQTYGTVWLNIIIFFYYGFLGVLLGSLSLVNIHKHFLAHTKKFTAEFMIMFICVLSSIGIGMGRFERWNSWDLFTQPLDIFRSFYTAITNHITATFIFSFSLFIYVTYKIVNSLTEKIEL